MAPPIIPKATNMKSAMARIISPSGWPEQALSVANAYPLKSQ
jgi:hypothetical protein